MTLHGCYCHPTLYPAGSLIQPRYHRLRIRNHTRRNYSHVLYPSSIQRHGNSENPVRYACMRHKQKLFVTVVVQLHSMQSKSETKQTTSRLSKGINNQSTHEQSHCDAYCDLNHAVRNIENIAIDIDS